MTQLRQSEHMSVTTLLTAILAPLIMVSNLVEAAHAQMNEHCTVSVLNRTAQVNSNGSWVISSVPANIGQVRVAPHVLKME